MKGDKRLLLLHNGREIATSTGKTAEFHVPLNKTGAGPLQVYVIAVIDSEGIVQRIASAPITLNVAAPK